MQKIIQVGTGTGTGTGTGGVTAAETVLPRVPKAVPTQYYFLNNRRSTTKAASQCNIRCNATETPLAMLQAVLDGTDVSCSRSASGLAGIETTDWPSTGIPSTLFSIDGVQGIEGCTCREMKSLVGGLAQARARECKSGVIGSLPATALQRHSASRHPGPVPYVPPDAPSALVPRILQGTPRML
ncbi:uncharacterized protein TRIREDRAFT_112338 [Trichoderma reesei QM6a]|uniref:Predicted protein n=2 Tax=Hypocrea jecorina TaxID=51453 RepID=G0RWT2_HYPJQ|nr:uncharacterized protein TRIREDRAFT_112338 [Trichoderma reesei QM6a]EGR44339.1 predicted protein [Trichoderma reesei QM6a]ETR97017.1 hypothetical protein M419DRAFT_134862 [Trichoderma reesei RUT C-30]